MKVRWKGDENVAMVSFDSRNPYDCEADVLLPYCFNLKEVDECLNRIGSRRRTKWRRRDGCWQAGLRRIERKPPTVVELRIG